VNGVTAAAVSLTAPVISIPGAVTGTTSVGLIATDGGITETGSVTTAQLTGSATGDASLTGTNNIAALGVPGTPFVDAGHGFTLIDAGTPLLTVNGISAAAVSLTAPVISIPGAVTGTTSVGLIATDGGITEAGSITTALLTGSSVGSATLTQDNAVGTLGPFNVSGGSLALLDATPLTIAGPIAANFLTITATGQMTLAGNIATIGAPLAQQSGPDPAPGGSTLQVLASAGSGAAQFIQTGVVTLTDPPNTTLRIQLPTTGTGGSASFADLIGVDANLVLALGSGTAAGNVQVGGLLVLGQGGAANLFGSVAGNATATAATVAQISPAVSPNYTFNLCTIGVVTCGAPPITPPSSPPVPPVSPPIVTATNPPMTQSVFGGLFAFLPGPFLPAVPALTAPILIVLPTPPLLSGQLAPDDVVPPNISFEDY
jgi:hypothetical protein